MENEEFVIIKGNKYYVKDGKLDLSEKGIKDISEIEGLKKMDGLIILNLSSNQLIEIKYLETLVNLEDLDLSNNQITEIKNLETLVNLEGLDLSYNNITEIKNLEALINLEGLFLSYNPIIKIKNLETLVKLEDLDLSSDNNCKLCGVIIELPLIIKKSFSALSDIVLPLMCNSCFEHVNNKTYIKHSNKKITLFFISLLLSIIFLILSIVTIVFYPFWWLIIFSIPLIYWGFILFKDSKKLYNLWQGRKCYSSIFNFDKRNNYNSK